MIADVVSYAIAGIGFIHAVGRSFVPKRFHTQHEHCYDARLPRISHLWRFVSHFPPAASASHKSAFCANEGSKVDALRQGAQAPPASQHTRGLEANDSRHRTS